MNERMSELYASACLYARDKHLEDKDVPAFIQCMSEKLAELIVRECVDIASQEDFDVMMKEGYPCSQTAKKIKEHFGVES